MNRRGWIGSGVLLLVVGGTGAGLAAWKSRSLRAAAEASASQPEPLEVVEAALAREQEYVRTTTSIGTVMALRSITLRSELAGTVREVTLASGQVVEEGTVLVALDVAVEEAELAAQAAQAALAETLLGRMERASENRGASAMDVDRARAERDIALANVARTQALIDRKTIRAPFRARVGMADVHPGQYLNEGAVLTTLQGVDDTAHVDFTVAQEVAAGLSVGQAIEVVTVTGGPTLPATIVALDARIDALTRNALARALIPVGPDTPSPGASVRVRVPLGVPRPAVVVPVSALRKGPAGDHVFVIAAAEEGRMRAHVRQVRSGAVLGDEVVIVEGLSAGEQVATSGSFKLREGALVSIAGGTETGR